MSEPIKIRVYPASMKEEEVQENYDQMRQEMELKEKQQDIQYKESWLSREEQLYKQIKRRNMINNFREGQFIFNISTKEFGVITNINLDTLQVSYYTSISCKHGGTVCNTSDNVMNLVDGYVIKESKEWEELSNEYY